MPFTNTQTPRGRKESPIPDHPLPVFNIETQTQSLTLRHRVSLMHMIIISHFIYPLPARIVGAPQMISQPASSVFLFSTALWDLANFRPVHSLMVSSHLSLCLPCLLPPFTVPCNIVLARPDERETCPYHCSLRLFTIVRSSCGPILACWI